MQVSCRAELAQLEADGQGEGFAAGCAVPEKKMLQENMDALQKQEQEVKSCMTAIAEARTGGGRTSELEARLALASVSRICLFKHDGLGV